MTDSGVVTIFHNPACGTSRNVLALIRAAGIAPAVIDYLKTPPPPAQIRALAAAAGVPLRALLRERGTPFADLGLGEPTLSDDALLDAIAAHPILLNRPIVVSPKGVRLCRPSDVVLDLLPRRPVTRILKEEGVPVLAESPVAGTDPALVAALADAGLPVTDLGEPGRQFFRYDTLDGETGGFGGLEPHGRDVLVRSGVVLPAVRGGGIGRNLVALLLFRAQAAGARQAWLLTTSAAPFFTALGFREMARDAAPAAIRASRQGAGLCPSSAPLLTRRISF